MVSCCFWLSGLPPNTNLDELTAAVSAMVPDGMVKVQLQPQERRALLSFTRESDARAAAAALADYLWQGHVLKVSGFQEFQHSRRPATPFRSTRDPATL